LVTDLRQFTGGRLAAMMDPNEARAALRDLNLFLAWMSAIVLVALMGWWLSESSPRDEDEPLNTTYTGETIKRLFAAVDRVFRRRQI
jgi:hypothetical protein